jgi:putative PIN family toxin of toxin-antitoxin system
MKVVCDTNILISALVFPGGSPDRFINLARLKEFELILSPDILSEFKSVLMKKFRYSEAEGRELTERVLEICTLIYPRERLKIITRKDSDNRILECAKEAQADFLVTSDSKDLLPLEKFGSTRIITARQFLEKFSTS